MNTNQNAYFGEGEKERGRGGKEKNVGEGKGFFEKIQFFFLYPPPLTIIHPLQNCGCLGEKTGGGLEKKTKNTTKDVLSFNNTKNSCGEETHFFFFLEPGIREGMCVFLR